jgi:hypothetical protein
MSIIEERCAEALNDLWAAGTQGARWHDLDYTERDRWREAVRIVLRVARHQALVDRAHLLQMALEMAADDADRLTAQEYIEMAEAKFVNFYGRITT